MATCVACARSRTCVKYTGTQSSGDFPWERRHPAGSWPLRRQDAGAPRNSVSISCPQLRSAVPSALGCNRRSARLSCGRFLWSAGVWPASLTESSSGTTGKRQQQSHPCDCACDDESQSCVWMLCQRGHQTTQGPAHQRSTQTQHRPWFWNGMRYNMAWLMHSKPLGLHSCETDLR